MLPPYSAAPMTGIAAAPPSGPVCACSGDSSSRQHALTSAAEDDIAMLAGDIPLAPRGGFNRRGSGTHTPTTLFPAPISPLAANTSFGMGPSLVPGGEHAMGRAVSQSQSTSRPPLAARFESLLDHSSQFERLIAGQESEAGEAPPTYDEVVAHPLPHHQTNHPD